MNNEQSEIHIPVLKNEVLKYLDPKPNENFIDCTIGMGGHAKLILEKNGPNGKVLGIEKDPELFKRLLSLKIERLVLANDSYSNLKEIVEKEGFDNISGILFDLGLSSWHLEKSGRGFSFLKNEPLDMRYNLNGMKAKDVLQEWPKKEIEKILKECGEERFAKEIAQEIVENRRFKKIEKTFQLVEVVKKAVPSWYRNRKIHFATKTFQALRIVVNHELENLKVTLPQALEVLEKKGRLVIFSFHSLEDRIVKNFLKENFKKGQIKILTPHTIMPTFQEVKKNPRARSAKLRAAIKI